MTSTPHPQADDDVVRAIRGTCVHISESAENAGLLAPIMVMIAQMLIRLFGKLEDMFILWRDGRLVIVPAQERHRVATTTRLKSRRSTNRRAARKRAHPICAQATSTAGRYEPIRAHVRTQAKSARRPVDRYPKSA